MELSSDGVTIWCKCETCGSNFYVTARGYGPKRRPRRYCKDSCKPSSIKQPKTIKDGRASRAIYLGSTTLVCQYCSTPFDHDMRLSANRAYCQSECREKAALTRRRANYRVMHKATKRCQRCEVVFEQRQGNPKYCTAKCRLKDQNDRMSPTRLLKCKCCEREFSYKGHGTPSTCSWSCRKALSFVASYPICSLKEAKAAFLAREAKTGCDVCGRTTKIKDGRNGLNVDHCHITGRIRGILCANCNKVEGLVGGSSDVLRMLADWIDRTGTIK
jgi:hypothetical protein